MIMLDAVSHKKEQQRINSHEIFQNLIYNVPLNKDPRKLTEQELYRKTRNNPVINPCENIRDLFPIDLKMLDWDNLTFTINFKHYWGFLVVWFSNLSTFNCWFFCLFIFVFCKYMYYEKDWKFLWSIIFLKL